MATSRWNSDLKDKKREAVVKVILDTTEEIWVTQGYNAIGMAPIARQIGIAVGTIYNYFKSKEKLIESLISSRMSDLTARLLEEVDSLGDASLEDKIDLFLTALYEGHPSIDRHRKFLVSAYQSDPSYFLSQNYFLESHVCAVLAPWLEDLRAKGLIHSTDTFLTSYLLMTVAKGFFELHLRGKATLPVAKSFAKTTYLQALGA